MNLTSVARSEAYRKRVRRGVWMTNVTDGKPSSMARSTTAARSSIPCLTWSPPGAHVDPVRLPDEWVALHAGQYSESTAAANLKAATVYSIFEAWIAAK